jgi:WD40 repeat protein
VATGQLDWTYRDFPEPVLSIAFSPDGRTLAVGGGSGTPPLGTIHLLDTATGRRVRSLMGHVSGVFVAFSPDGKMLASVSWDATGALWDLATGQRVRTLKSPMLLTSVAFSPDGRRLATGDADGTVRLWDVATGREVLMFRELTGDTTVAFSRDGRRLAVRGIGGTVILEAASKEEVAAREAREGLSVG